MHGEDASEHLPILVPTEYISTVRILNTKDPDPEN